MFVTIKKKYLQVGAVAAFLIMVSLWVMASLSRPLNTLDSLSLFKWATYPSAEYTEKESSFNIEVSKLFEERKESDMEDRYWQVGVNILPEQTELTIPAYFHEPDSSRTDLMPFDPRFTLGIYYNYLRRNGNSNHPVEAPFHWADWTDMKALIPYLFEKDESKRDCSFLDFRAFEILKDTPEDKEKYKDKKKERFALDPALFCKNDRELPSDYDDGNRLRPGFNIMSYFGQMPQDLVIMAGKAFLYGGAEPPASVIFLTDEGSYTMIPNKKAKLLHSGLVEEYMEVEKTDKLNTLKEFSRLKQELPPNKEAVVSDYMIPLKHEDFVFDAPAIVKSLENRDIPLNAREQKYLESLKVSISLEQDPPKYFNEAKSIGTGQGHHYDYRFFNGIDLGYDDRTAKLHRMTRVWLSFCRKNGMKTWLAHGSLLSWYWNGISFPWDDDIDVQMPIMDLHKLSMNFNQSLVVEDSADGFGRYFVDCATYISLRTHTNGNNNIDARFIDMDTGYYIDITGLALSDENSPGRYDHLIPQGISKGQNTNLEVNEKIQVYNCRNRHFSSLSELSPLVRTFAEGEIAYVPKSYSAILAEEYKKGLLEKFFKGRFFVPQLRLWVSQDDLRFFLRHRREWITYYNTSEVDLQKKKTKTEGDLTKLELEQLLNLSESDLLELLMNDELLLEYYSSRDITSIHEHEIMRLLFGKSTSEIVSNLPDFLPLKYEPFLYRLRHDYDTFEKRVEELHQFYLSNMASA